MAKVYYMRCITIKLLKVSGAQSVGSYVAT